MIPNKFSDPLKSYTMINIPIADIDAGTRARVDYGKLTELADSFDEVGLIQPLSVVAKVHAGYTEQPEVPYLLLAGGRRFEACKLKKIEFVPCKVYTVKLEEEDLFRIELYENVHRKDMEWHEEVLLRDKLHRLNLKRHGVLVSDKTVATAKLELSAKDLGTSVTVLSTDLRIAQAIKDIPELAKVKSKTELVKLLKGSKNAVDIQNQLKGIKAEQSDVLTTPQKIVEAGQRRYIVGDFFERAKQLPDKSFDLIICDPMYGIDFENLNTNNNSTRTNIITDIPASQYPEYMDKLIKECGRLMKDNAWILMWHAIRWQPMILETFERHKITAKDRPFIWGKKPTGNMAPEYQLSSAYEPCFYARKGTPKISHLEFGGDFCYWEAPPKGERAHPTEKPMRIVRGLVNTFSELGAKVLVPFAGSGVDIAYCVGNFRDVIGFDIVEHLKNTYDLRLAKNDFQGEKVFQKWHTPSEERDEKDKPLV